MIPTKIFREGVHEQAPSVEDAEREIDAEAGTGDEPAVVFGGGFRRHNFLGTRDANRGRGGRQPGFAELTSG